ncbi:hypothetical protein AB834_02820 [PVC group bacterium (ex Bugula neritina AB1)]|nr:hypothetical protein AB834_02820 [PVC group bacterium (ex Bugula neritina AB1)]
MRYIESLIKVGQNSSSRSFKNILLFLKKPRPIEDMNFFRRSITYLGYFEIIWFCDKGDDSNRLSYLYSYRFRYHNNSKN